MFTEVLLPSATLSVALVPESLVSVHVSMYSRSFISVYLLQHSSGSLYTVLKAKDASIGVASICNGGGGASAVVIERLN